MPPAKRKAEQPLAAAAPTARVTRSAAKLAAGDSVPVAAVKLAVKKKEMKKVDSKKAKRETKKPKGDNEKKKRKKNEEIDDEVVEGSGTVETDEGSVVDTSNKTIVVEYCKQCNSFKTRANMVKEALEKRTSGTTVILNPEKPRRGCFEIREEGGKKFISLLDMKRPFKPMKDLDMDKVISDIIEEISS